MKLICQDFESIVHKIKQEHKKIVMFGAGVVGQVTIPNILRQYGVLECVDCYVDNDSSKWGTTISVCGEERVIQSPKYLSECKVDRLLFINISRYSEVLDQIESMDGTREMECYLTPMLCIHNFCMDTSKGNIVMQNEQMIPKKINYMWLGRKPLPDNLKRCMDTWYKYCPDYEIKEWNEDNYDISKHPYMEEAYKNGGYGFVPDYARIDILYNYGGIYMDTDIELIRNLDPLLNQGAFCGVEKWQIVNLGGCCGAVPGHPMMKKFLDERKDIHFIDSNGKLNKTTCGFYDTNVVLKEGYVINGTTQNIGGMNIYAYDYFHPYDYMSGTTNITDNTFSIHRFNGGWMDEKMQIQNLKSQEVYLNLYNSCKM